MMKDTFPGFNKRIYFQSVLVFVLTFCCLVVNTCPSVYWLDSGELQAAIPVFDIPHSPSFPTYIQINHPVIYLPFGDLAFRANLGTSLTGALLGVIIFITVLRYFRVRKQTESWLAVLAGVCAIVNPMVWFQNLKAEIYSLNLLFVIAILLCVPKVLQNLDSPRKRFRNTAIIALLLGAGLSTHSLLTLHIVPVIGIIFLFVCWKYKINELVTIFLLLILSISTYLYLPVRSSVNPSMDTGNPEHVMNFVNAMTRRGTYNRFFGNAFQEWFQNIGEYYHLVTSELSVPVFWIAMIGLTIWLFKDFLMAGILSASASINIAVTIMNRNFNANPDTGPAYLMLSSVCIILGFFYFWLFVTRYVQKRKPIIEITVVGMILLALLPVIWVGKNSISSNLSTDYSAGKVTRACLDICDPDSAVFFGVYHNFAFVTAYLQSIEKYREDLIPVNRSEMVYWPGGLENLIQRFPDLTQSIKVNPFREDLEYLAARSSRHSSRIPYTQARGLLFNNNSWMAMDYSKNHSVYWFPSEDDHLLHAQVEPWGPMLKLGFNFELAAETDQIDLLLLQRIHCSENASYLAEKGRLVLATYYDLQCMTLNSSGNSVSAQKSAVRRQYLAPFLVKNCDL